MGRKKGGIKTHTIIKYDIDIPMMVDYTAAAVHDHEQMDKMLSLPAPTSPSIWDMLTTICGSC